MRIDDTTTNTIIDMDDAALALDIKLSLGLKHIALMPDATARSLAACAAMDCTSQQTAWFLGLVREGQKIMVRHGKLAAVTV